MTLVTHGWIVVCDIVPKYNYSSVSNNKTCPSFLKERLYQSCKINGKSERNTKIK